MKTTLWIPSVQRPPWPCVDSWMNIDWPRGDGCGHNFVRSGGGAFKYIWNQVIRDFLKTDYDNLWSCHDDVMMHPGTLKRLLSWDKPLVSALAFSRGGVIFPLFWEGTEEGQRGYKYKVKETAQWFKSRDADVTFGVHLMEPKPEDALFSVGFASTGCMLIHRSVLEAMTDPWFMEDDDFKHGGEDRYFCENARAAGFETYVDRSSIVGHLGGDVPIGLRDFMVGAMVMAPEIFVTPEAVAAAQEIMDKGGYGMDKKEKPAPVVLEVQDSVMGAKAEIINKEKDNG